MLQIQLFSDVSNGVFEIKSDAVVLDTEPNNTASEAQILTYGDEVEGSIFNPKAM